MSRTRCECSANEKWIACLSLDDVKWWSNQGLDCEYEIVLHLAEPVKKLALEHEVLDVIDSQVAFLRNASKKSRFVFYPQTYDRVLRKSETTYLRIKMDVIA